MSVRTSGNTAFGIVISLLLAFALISPCLSDQAGISGLEKGLNLIGIWFVEGLVVEGGVIMALEQNGSELFGRAKYEPDGGRGWNGQVIGSVAGEEIELVIVSGQDEAPVSRKLTGRYESVNQSIVGEFIKISGGRITTRSQFTAIWINPDLSGYVPAAITELEQVSCEEGQDIRDQGVITDLKETGSASMAAYQTANNTSQGSSLPTSKYYDVHQDADSIMTGICGLGRGL